MAFEVAPPDLPIHLSHRHSVEHQHPLRIGPQGPVMVFRGPEDWAHFEVAPPEWGHRFSTDPEVSRRGEAARNLSNGFGRVPLAVNAQGQVGYDLDWMLLVALGSDNVKLGDFRALLERPGCDPCVAFPTDKGPGGGQPLPFAILNATRRTHEERMRLLASLPPDALTLTHQGKTLTEAAYDRLQKDKATSLIDHLLFVWVQTTTGQPFPEGAFLKGVPTLTTKTSEERKQVATILASKPLTLALGSRMDVKNGPGGTATRMEDKLKAYLLLAPRQQAMHAMAPEAPVRPRRFRA